MVQPKADAPCAYSTDKRRTGIEIIIDCADCDAEPGLEKPRCFRNVIALVQAEGMPAAITLRSHIERRYGVTASRLMGRTAGILNKLDVLQGQLSRDARRGDACAACTRGLSANLSTMAGSLRGMDIQGFTSSASAISGMEFGSERPSCGDCAGLTRVQVADIVGNVRELERDLVRGRLAISGAEQ